MRMPSSSATHEPAHGFDGSTNASTPNAVGVSPCATRLVTIAMTVWSTRVWPPMAFARRTSALARATRISASAWSAWSRAPMFSPTSMSAISIDTI